jgi:hypothetical protein
MSEFAELIEDVEQMPYENQEIFIDIINKRFSEIKRERFIRETLESGKEYERGEFFEGNSVELFKALKI